jgi:hypothetical protein
MWIRYLLREEEKQQPAANPLSKFNCQFQLPGGPWKSDDDSRRRFHLNMCMSRPAPTDHVGLFVRDYETRMPSEAELVEQAVAKLRDSLRGVEWERKPVQSTQLAGLPAVALEFVGTDPDQVSVAGECYCVGYRGYAYWLFTWGPEGNKESLAVEWDTLRRNFSVLGGREGWQEKPRETGEITGTKANYRLTYPIDLWKRKSAEDYDARADAVLEAFEPDSPGRVQGGARGHASRAGLFHVIVLPKVDNLESGVSAALQYVAKHYEKQLDRKPLLKADKEKGGVKPGIDTNFGKIRGHVVKLQVMVEDSDSFNRYVMAGVTLRQGLVVVLLGECDWNRRDFWEQEFLALIQTIRPD